MRVSEEKKNVKSTFTYSYHFFSLPHNRRKHPEWFLHWVARISFFSWSQSILAFAHTISSKVHLDGSKSIVKTCPHLKQFNSSMSIHLIILSHENLCSSYLFCVPMVFVALLRLFWCPFFSCPWLFNTGIPKALSWNSYSSLSTITL